MAYARALAAKTEFWRCGRKVAGVLHFCGLGYSRPGGQTSDNFISLDPPTLEPYFRKYVGDAFAPVGLMIDFWADEVPGGTTLKVPVVVINDLDKDWEGSLARPIAAGANVNVIVASKHSQVRVPALGRVVSAFEPKLSAEPGSYTLLACVPGADGEPFTHSVRDFRVPRKPAAGGK